MDLSRSGYHTTRAAEFPAFDWLRFAMASVVVLGHAGIECSFSGNLAVQVFFALSGWLIGGILLRLDRYDLPLFFYNRATRIWVPYFFAIAVLYAVSSLKNPINLRWLEFLFYDVTFTHNWFSLRPSSLIALSEMPLNGTGNHFWSIAVEEQFYLMAPFFIVFTKYGRLPLWWIGIALFFCVSGVTGFASICLGVAAAAANAAHPNFHTSYRAIGIFSGLAIVAFGAIIMKAAYEYAAPIFAISTVLLSARPGIRTEIGKFFGGLSYPLYLNHWQGVFIANALAGAIPIISPQIKPYLAYVAAVACGTVAYLLVDRWVLATRQHYFTPARGWRIAIIAYALLAIGLTVGIVRWSIFA